MEILKNKLAVKYTFTDYRAKAKSLGLEKENFYKFFLLSIEDNYKKSEILKNIYSSYENIRKIKLKN